MTKTKLPVLQPSNPAPAIKESISYEQLTQAYSTWGGKLLQHTDVLYGIQVQKEFRPITVQLAPTEACDSNCPFCSVSWRAVDKKIPFAVIEKGLREFKALGAKSIEITGGGNPLLYKDGTKNINDVIELAYDLGYEIGVITNTEKLSRHIKPENAEKLSWIRISLIKLDEGKIPEDYDFTGFPTQPWFLHR
jgi:tRNA A37 methylthiotransferase MiaB